MSRCPRWRRRWGCPLSATRCRPQTLRLPGWERQSIRRSRKCPDSRDEKDRQIADLRAQLQQANAGLHVVVSRRHLSSAQPRDGFPRRVPTDHRASQGYRKARARTEAAREGSDGASANQRGARKAGGHATPTPTCLARGDSTPRRTGDSTAGSGRTGEPTATPPTSLPCAFDRN